MTGKSAPSKQFAYQLICITLGTVGIVAYALSKFISGGLIVLITAVGTLGFFVALVALILHVKQLREVVRAVAISVFSVMLVSYAIVFTVVFVFQDAVANETSTFFQPQSLTPEAAQRLIGAQVEGIDVVSGDGTRLRGWLVRNSDQPRSPLMIYFGGSGSESSQMIPYAQKLKGWLVALVNYRGFGLSEGTPSHAHVLADATFLYDTLAQRTDVDSSRIVVMGYSLGTGVAVYLADQRPVASTVLVAPYDSMTLIGVKPLGLYTPLGGIMNRYFDSASRARKIQSPLLCLIGTADSSIPPELSVRLVDQWGGKTQLNRYLNENHDLLLHDNNSWMDIADFLQSVDRNPAP